MIASEQVILDFILTTDIPANAVALMCQDLDFNPLSPSWDTVQRKDSIREAVPSYPYRLYPELCLSCMQFTGITSSEYTVLDCHRCYTTKNYDHGKGYYRLQTIALIFGLTPHGREHAYLSQLIYRALGVHPDV